MLEISRFAADEMTGLDMEKNHNKAKRPVNSYFHMSRSVVLNIVSDRYTRSQ